MQTIGAINNRLRHPRRRGYRALFVVYAIILFIVAALSDARASSLDVSTTGTVTDIFDHMIIVAPPGFDVQDSAMRREALALSEQEKPQPGDWSKTDNGSWAFVRLKNSSDMDRVFRLDSQLTAATGFRFYTVNDGRVERVLTADYPFVPTDRRESGDQFFASSPITVPAGGSLEIWAELQWADTPDYFRIRLEPESIYVQERLRDTLLDALYFGAGAALVAFFIAFSVLLNSKPARRYALFFFLLVVYHFYGRGYLGQFILSDRPELLLEATRVFQAVIVIAYLAFVSAFLDTRNQYARLHRFIVFLIGVCVVVTALEKLVFWEWFEHLALFVAVVFAATCAFGAYVAIRDGKPGSGFFALGVAILFGYVGLGVVGAYTIFYDQQYIVTQVTLAAQLFDGMVFAAAIIRQTFALRHERDQALKAELAASREKLELNERLLAARDDLDDARRIADERRERLAMTSHDLRQPLTSLRLALEESRAKAPELGDKLEAGLEYLNSILSTTLHESRPDKLPGNEAELDNPHEITPVSEAIPLQLILQNISRMFADEAQAKGLSFKTVPTSQSVLAEPVPLIRMTSNLVSNAIKYTKSGGILVGVRSRDGDVALEVWDTGPGLVQEEIKTLTERYRRGGHEGNEDGEGLGLASVADLAVAQGARLDIRSRPGRGSVFSISRLKRADCGS